MEAARRLLRAHKVHHLLMTSFSKEDLSRFPLLDHHWPLVVKFRYLHLLKPAYYMIC
jgi:hypothetical protein